MSGERDGKSSFLNSWFTYLTFLLVLWLVVVGARSAEHQAKMDKKLDAIQLKLDAQPDADHP